MLQKTGRFLLLISLIMLVLFVSSDIAQTPDYTMLLSGIALLVFAIMLSRRSRPPIVEHSRFRTLRKIGSLLSAKDENPNEDGDGTFDQQ